MASRICGAGGDKGGKWHVQGDWEDPGGALTSAGGLEGWGC